MNKDLHCFVKDSFELNATGRGVLDGKTFALKDNIALQGHVSSFGHPAWRASHATSNTTAPVVIKLLQVGASMAGLAKLDQLTYSLTGNVGEGEPPINSLYPDRFTGGSSSGCASAVAAKLVDFGVGTDTSGSVRVPASACGIYGIRPTCGRIETVGVIPLAQSFDTVGLMARDPKFLQAVFRVIAKEPSHSIAPIKRILLPIDCIEIVDKEVAEVVQRAANQFGTALGIECEEIKIKDLFDIAVSELYVRLQAREIWEVHGEWAERHMSELAPNVQDRLQNLCKPLAASPDNQKRADHEAWQNYRQNFVKWVTPGTVIIKPVTPGLPPLRKTKQNEPPSFRQLSLRLTSPASLAGAPEVVVPERAPSGSVYGVGLLGAPGDDFALLNAVCIRRILKSHIQAA